MGITSAIGAGLTGLGFGAETAAAAAPILFDVGAGAAGGAALGGGTAALTGGNIGKGALYGGESGALTGGGIGAGELALGGSVGETAAGALGGAAGGALGKSVTGGNALQGAIGGGIAGGIAGSAGAPTGGTGGGATSIADPSSISPDVSLPWTTDQTPFSSNTSTTNVGTGTTGTQGLSPSLASAVNTAGYNPTTLSTPGVDAIAAGQGASGADAAGEAASPSSVSQFLSNPSFKSAGNILTSNPGAAISAAGLGYEALQGAKYNAAEESLKAQAGQENAQGNQLESYLKTGTLPPGLQAGVNQATQAAIATIKSKYASQGSSGSSAEQQEISAVQERAQAAGAQMAMQLLQTGISETGMASQLYGQLLQQQTASDTGLSTAISNFASAAAGGNSGKGGEFKITPG